jgi:hypothetical protein
MRFPISLLNIVPPGCIMPYGDEVPPPGYLSCDGALHPRATYPKLFDIIGYDFGGGGDFFAVPDTRNRFIRGSSFSRPIGTTEESRIKVHTHTLETDSIVDDSFETIGIKGLITNSGGDLVNGPNTAGLKIVSDLNNADFAEEMRPKNMAISFVIKY